MEKLITTVKSDETAQSTRMELCRTTTHLLTADIDEVAGKAFLLLVCSNGGVDAFDVVCVWERAIGQFDRDDLVEMLEQHGLTTKLCPEAAAAHPFAGGACVVLQSGRHLELLPRLEAKDFVFRRDLLRRIETASWELLAHTEVSRRGKRRWLRVTWPDIRSPVEVLIDPIDPPRLPDAEISEVLVYLEVAKRGDRVDPLRLYALEPILDIDTWHGRIGGVRVAWNLEHWGTRLNDGMDIDTLDDLFWAHVNEDRAVRYAKSLEDDAESMFRWPYFSPHLGLSATETRPLSEHEDLNDRHPA